VKTEIQEPRWRQTLWIRVIKHHADEFGTVYQMARLFTRQESEDAFFHIVRCVIVIVFEPIEILWKGLQGVGVPKGGHVDSPGVLIDPLPERIQNDPSCVRRWRNVPFLVDF